MKRVGVVLSGCGVHDGSEIHEAVLTLLALDRAGAEAVCFAPDSMQAVVIDHFSGEKTTGQRNILVESARIARGHIRPLSEARADELDALIVPGGFGAVLNLSDIADKGAECGVDADLRRLTREIHKRRKAIGFICIASALLPKLLDTPLRLTIGTDIDTAEMIEDMGGIHVVCPVDDIVVDADNKVITTPGYMLAASIAEAAKGIDKLVARVLELTA
ncbi:isoprenoid biosynthesis glyoxalase ElbB [Acerihabitans arboris]|uniref:Glyoxalase n=1 Tax=Acerihabitans arboris TaxID=2691583 RepID=A0A845SLR2_9GAMM|nr:isoprenoid biosynthesis glyoxalase ElbB [Acerihabitans arboris]NDL63561.1 isoprenoid biosynthesis glyoxalase ElbB [Acerihabitans arboris]